MMAARPRHLHLIHDRDPELEPEPPARWNVGMLLTCGTCLLVWAGVGVLAWWLVG